MPGVEVPSGWNLLTLGDLFEFSNGVNANKSAYGGGTPFINVLDVIENESLAENAVPGRVTLPLSLVERYQVRYGDVLLNRTSETQDEVGLASVYIGSSPVVFGGFVFRARPTTKFLDVGYLMYALRAHNVREQMIARGQGGIRANIGQRDLKTVRVLLPPRGEQRAIAEALADVDGLISSLERMIAKKRAIKQGLMQQLLTGRTRLPGFDTGEWKSRPLRGEVILISGAHVMAKDCNEQGFGTPYLTGPADFPDGVIRQEKFTTRPIAMCGKGDILVTVKGSGTGLMVRADADYCISRQLMALRSSEWNLGFLFYSMMSNALSIKAASAGLIPGLSRSDLLDQEVPIPPTVAEQVAIADALSDADAEIALLRRRLTKARHIKQGMMQQLLTGRTRLPPKEAEP